MIKKILLITVLAISALSAGTNINTDRVVIVCDDDGCRTVLIFDGE